MLPDSPCSVKSLWAKLEGTRPPAGQLSWLARERSMYTPGQVVRVEFYKYPERRRHYWWEARVVEVRRDGAAPDGLSAVLLHMPVGFSFHHESKGLTLRMDHQAFVAFFAGRWYSGGPDLDASGRVLEYYWNVQTPPTFEPDRIWQYDLELDVRARADHVTQVRDVDEFEARRHLYPADWVEAAWRAVEEIRTHMREARWPVLPPSTPGPWMARP